MQIIKEETKTISIDIEELSIPFNRQTRQSSAIVLKFGVYENDNQIGLYTISYDDTFRRPVRDQSGAIVTETYQKLDHYDNVQLEINGVLQFEEDGITPIIQQVPVYIPDIRNVTVGEREFWESVFGQAIWGATENTLVGIKTAINIMLTQGKSINEACFGLADFIKSNQNE